jgi:hypothetical protein
MDRAQTTDSAFWGIQDQMLTEAQSAIEGAVDRVRALKEELAGREAVLLPNGADAGIAFGALVVRANLMIRRELELPLDAEAYLGLMERSQESLARDVDNFHEQTSKDRRQGTASASASARTALTQWFGRHKNEESAEAPSPVSQAIPVAVGKVGH